MAGYLRQAEVFGTMRRMWLEVAFWTREAVNLPTRGESLERALRMPQILSGYFGDYYSDATVKQIEIALTGYVRAVVDSAENLAQHADRVVRVLVGANGQLSEGELRDHVNVFTRLSSTWVSHTKSGQHKSGIAVFDQLVDACAPLADVLSKGLIAQFEDRFK